MKGVFINSKFKMQNSRLSHATAGDSLLIGISTCIDKRVSNYKRFPSPCSASRGMT